ncbi:hypothetical protein [uncultured Methanofollis sp.]|uniref:hypothetical protein n=1 Tax=uncultured Methanofollis sp. TaxID=262500 RepID=UPI0026291C47|nr:hypothetical protein [uncultured Methanofollis sp.]
MNISESLRAVSPINLHGYDRPRPGIMERIDRIVLLFLLLLFVAWSPAAAKIVVEPEPAEVPADAINVDDEVLVPWWAVLPR